MSSLADIGRSGRYVDDDMTSLPIQDKFDANVGSASLLLGRMKDKYGEYKEDTVIEEKLRKKGIKTKSQLVDKIKEAYEAEKYNRENKYGAMLGMGGLDRKGKGGRSLGDTISSIVERLVI